MGAGHVRCGGSSETCGLHRIWAVLVSYVSLPADSADAEHGDGSAADVWTVGVGGALTAAAVELLCGPASPGGSLVDVSQSSRLSTAGAEWRQRGHRAVQTTREVPPHQGRRQSDWSQLVRCYYDSRKQILSCRRRAARRSSSRGTCYLKQRWMLSVINLQQSNWVDGQRTVAKMQKTNRLSFEFRKRFQKCPYFLRYPCRYNSVRQFEGSLCAKKETAQSVLAFGSNIVLYQTDRLHALHLYCICVAR